MGLVGPVAMKSSPVVQTQRQMTEGFRILCLKDGSGTVVAFAGFRIFETYFDGKVI